MNNNSIDNKVNGNGNISQYIKNTNPVMPGTKNSISGLKKIKSEETYAAVNDEQIRRQQPSPEHDQNNACKRTKSPDKTKLHSNDVNTNSNDIQNTYSSKTIGINNSSVQEINKVTDDIFDENLYRDARLSRIKEYLSDNANTAATNIFNNRSYMSLPNNDNGIKNTNGSAINNGGIRLNRTSDSSVQRHDEENKFYNSKQQYRNSKDDLSILNYSPGIQKYARYNHIPPGEQNSPRNNEIPARTNTRAIMMNNGNNLQRAMAPSYSGNNSASDANISSIYNSIHGLNNTNTAEKLTGNEHFGSSNGTIIPSKQSNMAIRVVDDGSVVNGNIKTYDDINPDLNSFATTALPNANSNESFVDNNNVPNPKLVDSDSGSTLGVGNSQTDVPIRNDGGVVMGNNNVLSKNNKFDDTYPLNDPDNNLAKSQLINKPENKYMGVEDDELNNDKKKKNDSKYYHADGHADKRKTTKYIGIEGTTFNDKYETKTEEIMNFLSKYSPFVNVLTILTVVYVLTFLGPVRYSDAFLFNLKGAISLFWFTALPHAVFNFVGLAIPFKTDKERYDRNKTKPRRFDNLYIVIVTRGDNRDAIMRSWNSHKKFQNIPKVRIHLLTDEPYYFENSNCFTCPRSFKCNAKYKARALEWYRRIQKFTKHDWILHMDEESIIDYKTVLRCIEFIKYSPHLIGQGVILYNQFNFWKNWVLTGADTTRVGDDLGRFHYQYEFHHKSLVGAHGSFLLNNGSVENDITWELTSFTEDYQFAILSTKAGYTCGQIDGIVREQSPQKLYDFMRQRRRWFCGISRMKLIKSRVWSALWLISSFSIPVSILALYLGIAYPESIPRWQALIINFNLSVIVVLMLNGSIIQSYDAGVGFFRGLLQVLMTLIFIPLSSLIESISLLYAILRPPKSFDVIKK